MVLDIGLLWRQDLPWKFICYFREKNDDGTYSLTITAMKWLAVERVKQEINGLFEGVRYSGNKTDYILLIINYIS